MLLDQLESIKAEALQEAETLSDESSLESYRVKYLGKKGRLTQAKTGIKDVPKEDKPKVGQKINEVTKAIQSQVDLQTLVLQKAADAASVAGIDVTLPGKDPGLGALHPINQVIDEALDAFRQMGFALAEGPEIETEWHCFDALNTPDDHPARNEKDTFYFENGELLRTQTSTVQVRTMENATEVPIRIVSPGAVYRRDPFDATHAPQFTQIEGLYVANDVSLAHLKGTLEFLFQMLLGDKTKVRFRPHFFPFTEPSFEIDVLLKVEGKPSKWVEIAGCGMVDPDVFEAICKKRGDRLFDPKEVSGFAFGFGADRLAMIRRGFSDIRYLFENDQRMLSQFRHG